MMMISLSHELSDTPTPTSPSWLPPPLPKSGIQGRSQVGWRGAGVGVRVGRILEGFLEEGVRLVKEGIPGQ